MILVDTNIIVDFWKNPSKKLERIFTTENIFICGIVKAELLHGARSEKDFRKILDALSEFPFLDIGDDFWELLGNTLFILRKNGLTIPFQDAALISLALKHNAMIWSNDKHFMYVKPVFSELRLWEMS